MEEIVFQVQGSSSKPYEVLFIKDGDSLTAICDCLAGTHGNACKHRLNILDGKTKGIVSDNAGKVPIIVAWLEGTDVAKALADVRAAEKGGADTKSELAAAKRRLARAMNS